MLCVGRVYGAELKMTQGILATVCHRCGRPLKRFRDEKKRDEFLRKLLERTFGPPAPDEQINTVCEMCYVKIMTWLEGQKN